MKRSLLTLLIIASALLTNAQTRLSIYEEFSGENCGPCATYNPGLWSLLSANSDKVILIKYQCPIPSAGPIFNQYKTVTQGRQSYYGVPFAPYGRLNGVQYKTGNISEFTQDDLNTGNTTSPFTLAVSGDWSTAGDSINITVNITAVTDHAPAGAAFKLRVGIIENLEFNYAPGTNGEKEFHNVVREMYPTHSGTTLPGTWTANQNQVVTLKGRVPYYVDKNHTRLVAWIQNDFDKSIAQASVSPYLPDVAVDLNVSALTEGSLSCAGGNLSPKITIKNTGTTTLTNATIFSRVNSGAWASKTWSGALAQGASEDVALDAVTAPAAGIHTFYDSVVVTGGDMNRGNNTNSSRFVVASTAPKALPINNTWEGAVPAGWYFYDSDGSGQVWLNGSGTNLAHNQSTYMAWFRIGTYTAGTSSMIVCPTPAVSGPTSMDFWVAYAQKDASNNDKLEVVSSADCGKTWSVLWSKAGSDLATTSPTATPNWLPDPSSGSADWKNHFVDLSNLAAGSFLAFRGTTGGGNNMFLDDIKIHTGVNGVKEAVNLTEMLLFPNPAKDMAKLTFSLDAPSKVRVEIVDITGRLVATVTNESMNAGVNSVDMNTSGLSTGVYSVKISTGSATVVQKLNIAR